MSVYDYEAVTLQGVQKPLSEYRGKAMLIVNTASKCGFTPQYTGLQKLYDEYKDTGFEILGFPSNQFANQEPGNEEEIAEFCQINHGVTFPMFAKVDVKGSTAHPLFQFLSKEAPGILGSKSIKWNFTKFLVDRDGRVVRRFAPTDTPEQIEKHIKVLLQS
ncbi:glutathione peroxidase [Paenibacillus sp. GCM10023252]|uniref:glutathione peroxidase n=1 Tax=Paenibacillus sp. GCM10023252 TaxID=3252649 RepID=UPI003623D8A7